MSAVYTRQRVGESVPPVPGSQRGAPPMRRLLADGATFGRYQVVRRVGWGGTSEVYEAAHLGLKKRVALKVLRSDLSGRDDVRSRFLREGELAARIQHPNVVDIIDVGACEGIPFIVMEYLEGETLAASLLRQGRVDAQHIVHVMLPVIAAVAAGHDGDIAHGDLKPGNIFLASDGRRRTMLKVLDFGMSRLMNEVADTSTSAARLLGTPHYMSSEQARGAPPDARSDQFALGVILYEALTGRLPWTSQTVLGLIHEVAACKYDAPRLHRPDLDPGLEQVVTRAMHVDPRARFESARAMATALLPFASLRAREYWALEFGSASARASRSNEAHIEPPSIESLRSADIPAAGAASPAVPAAGTQATAALLSGPVSSAPLPATAAVLVTPADDAATPFPLSQPPGGEAAFGSSDPATLLYRPRRRRRAGPWVALAAVALLGAAGAAAVFGGYLGGVRPQAAHEAAITAPAATTFDVALRIQPSSAQVEFDGKPVGQGGFTASLPVDGTTHVIRLSAPGFEPVSLTFRDAPPPPAVELVPAPASEPATPPLAAAPAETVPPAAALPAPVARVPGPLPTVARPPPAASAAAPTQPTPAPTSWPTAPRTDNRDPWAK